MNTAAKSYDYIIAGAGAAGLSLLCYLLDQPALRQKRILLLDRQNKQVNDRTWCFWQVEDSPFESCLKHQWQQLHFYSDNFSSLLDISPYRYKMLESLPFYDYCFQKLQQAPQVDFIEDEISSIESDGRVIGKQAEYQAQYVFNSARFQIPKVPGKYYLVQHFKGIFIQTKVHAFNPAEPTLMDFRVPQHNDCRFVYVLPVSKYEALVEYTGFSEAPLSQAQYDQELKNYIGRYLHLENYAVTHSEYGEIPMTNAPFKRQESEAVFNIGTAGGATKASTGYTFTFIQKQCAAIAARLAAGKTPLATSERAFDKFQLYDSIFLRVLAEKKHPAWKVFEAMFDKLPATAILKFLNEQSSLYEDFQVMNAVDKPTFVQAALKELLKKL